MLSSHTIADRSAEGWPTVLLSSPEVDVSASIAPQAGMVGCSLFHRGEQLLALGDGLSAYAERGSTMGIPLLHPWANRLSGFEYAVGSTRFELDRSSPFLHFDPNGLPIHGLLAASPWWAVTERDAGAERARLAAQLDFGAHPDLLALFPFPHVIELAVELRGAELAIATTLRATGSIAVPISFGFHPYLRLPGVPRSEWWVELPVRRRLVADRSMIPTGETEPVAIEPGPLGEGTYDDGFDQLADPPEFVLAGGGRRITVRFGEGYPYAQVYAPAGQELICFEPMTAPTNALMSGDGLRLVEPGGSFRAEFSVAVS